jgi:hypothetical protein
MIAVALGAIVDPETHAPATCRQPVNRIGTVKRLLAGVALVLIVLIGGVFVHALSLNTTDATAWFTADGLLVATVALVAATAAASFAYPAYSDWRRTQPRPGDFTIAVAARSTRRDQEFAPLDTAVPHEVTGGIAGIYVRITVRNRGTGVVRAGELQIAVPAARRIKPDDDPRIVHYAIPASVAVFGLDRAAVTQASVTVVRDDFPPGYRMYHVRVDTNIPAGTEVPLLATLSGTGLHEPEHVRVVLVARDWPKTPPSLAPAASAPP